MASRCLALTPKFARSSGARFLSTTRDLCSRKRDRSGAFGEGFLFGFSLASAFAAYHLLDEYKIASAALQASVEELQASTEKVSAHVRRIEAVEKDLKALAQSSASKDDLSRVRAELKKVYDGLHIEFLDLRSHVWGMQQDLHSLAKKDATSVRV
ncbi:hypothetical protein BDR07DRAFT_1419941 [Suillus spraguei]|nr:hypothetical protein BDR07DRAFT_1419941 [Suillus spraguei]